jgi:glutamate racemase
LATTNILVIDSGVGGLPYLSTIFQHIAKLPLAIRIDYLADNEAFPYGIKPKADLIHHLHQLAKTIHVCQAYHFIVIACNTASLYGADLFGKYFGDSHVITTTPTMLLNQSHLTLPLYLMATTATCTAYADHPAFIKLPADALIAWIEKEYPLLSPADRSSYLQNFANIHLADIPRHTTLVLGCTHFLHIRPPLEQLAPHLYFIDTRAAVAATLFDKLLAHSHLCKQGKVQRGKLYLSQYQINLIPYQKIAQEYHLEFSQTRLTTA